MDVQSVHSDNLDSSDLGGEPWPGQRAIQKATPRFVVCLSVIRSIAVLGEKFIDTDIWIASPGCKGMSPLFLWELCYLVRPGHSCLYQSDYRDCVEQS